MATPWTLEKELCGLADAAAIVVEEFIPEVLAAFLRHAPMDSGRLFDQVIRYAATLERHWRLPAVGR